MNPLHETDDFGQLTRLADQIAGIMNHVPGITDIGVFDVSGQPSRQISIDRDKAARYGLQPLDVNNVMQAAVGGAPVTQIIEGDRRFDFALRYSPQFRSTPEDISRILLPSRMAARFSLVLSPMSAFKMAPS